eukprot:TRINITY_DN2127_c0_g2_i3.p1 TRINITY_DN2127_c0_g2~~TRINITY_DN2127_c0_g2_i3.p1  ORF type:complete len:219 (-),score=49.21 TRINITY_DN2127_c0_g2_i3:46-702(-)
MKSEYELRRESQIHERFDYNFKVTVAGRTGVGKTSLIQRIAEDKFSESYMQTIAGNVFKLQYRVRDCEGQKNLQVALWDTSGEEQYFSVTKLYFNGTNAVLLLYDITDKQSMYQLPYWIKRVSDCVGPMTLLYIIGSKNDLIEKREVDMDEVENLANKVSCTTFEVSSKTGDGVEELVREVIVDLIECRNNPMNSATLREGRKRLSTFVSVSKKKSCC